MVGSEVVPVGWFGTVGGAIACASVELSLICKGGWEQFFTLGGNIAGRFVASWCGSYGPG